MSTETISPFIKWAGGKKQLLPQLMQRVPASYRRYYEPFIGGGAFLFALEPRTAVINDVNEQLLNVYRQLKTNVQELLTEIQRLDSIPCDKERYLDMRERYNEKIRTGKLDVECAALMIWMNKHCFNGLYRVNAKGMFNVPYNNKVSGVSVNAENLKKAAQYLSQQDVTILHGDFEQACASVEEGDFVYFDSPYVPVSDTANFTDYTKNGFSCKDHERLAELFRRLDRKGAFLMLSNHNVPLVHELYAGYSIEEVCVKRLINRNADKRTGSEVIITNY